MENIVGQLWIKNLGAKCRYLGHGELIFLHEMTIHENFRPFVNIAVNQINI